MEDQQQGGSPAHIEACTLLRVRFPHMFHPTPERPDFFRFSPAIGDGWLPIFIRLCEATDGVLRPDEKPLWRWHQVKEKFGGLRTYGSLLGEEPPLYLDMVEPGVGVTSAVFGRDNGIWQRVMPLIRAAEAEAANTCERCGAQPASIDRTGGYLLTLCRTHAEERQRKALL